MSENNRINAAVQVGAICTTERGLAVELWYPGEDPGEPRIDEVRIGLMHVRAADDIIVRYDFERDGYAILQPTIHRWASGDDTSNEGLREVAFVPAWHPDADIDDD